VHKKGFKHLVHSVFFRLLAASILAGIALTLSVLIGFIALRHNVWESLESHLTRYARYMAEEIGDPPNREKALAITKDSSMTVICYRSPTENWVVPKTQSIPEVGTQYYLWINKKGMLIGKNNRGHFLRLSLDNGELFFWLIHNKNVEEKVGRGFLLLCAGLILILTCSYLYIRRVMHPIHWLNEAMDQFGSGNLTYRMPLKRNDEFQALAESMNKMAAHIQSLIQAKERLLLDVSHELRSPIARLKVGLELLPQTESKASLQDDLREMETMVTEILEASRLYRSTTALNYEMVESSALIQSVIQEFSQRPPGIKFMDVHHHSLRLDPKKARVVLRNVIDNALKYSSNSSKPVELTTTHTDRGLNIHITDYGIGIPTEAQNQIFEPFFRADASRSRQTGGFGLGLSMCKAIMEAHGGTIQIFSQENKGTKVTILFPLK
jgi:signal transduction histidine kinase